MSIRINGEAVEITTFPGGEPHVQLGGRFLSGECVSVTARIRNFNDLGELLVVKSALDGMGVEAELFLPYFPGARQDNPLLGEEAGARLYADIINSAEFETVTFVDPHSPVISNLLENGQAIDLSELSCFTDHFEWLEDNYGQIDGIIAPDAGAEKRAFAVAQNFFDVPIFYARKHRDSATGRLSGFSCEDLPGPGHYLVVDDICDGGGTFIGLAEEIHRKPPINTQELHLWVTHGIFSKGLEELGKHYATIGTTDSWTLLPPVNNFLRVYPLDEEEF